MKIENFIKRNFIAASAFASVTDLKKELLQYEAIVIIEDGQYFGVLTAYDIVRKSHIHAIDCLCEKSKISIKDTIEIVLSIMKNEKTDILPVFDKNKIIGLVFKNDILDFLNEHNKELRTEIKVHTDKLIEQNNEFQNKILQQKQELDNVIELRTKELIELVATKDKFISIIAHELRNPFNTILGFLNLLLQNLRTYDIDKIEKFLTITFKTVNITFELLTNLLDWLNAKNRKIPFNPEKICLNEFLSEEIENTSNFALDKQISLVNSTLENFYVHVDRNMLKIITRNLLTNAIKYTETCGKINISAKETEQFIEITVKDNGIGITPDIIENIFDFNRFRSTEGTAHEKGTGLGLLLCKEFVEIEGGKIWVESVLGQGSEFKFTLPKQLETNINNN